MTARQRPAPVMVIRAARVPAGGWIVHDMRDPRTVSTPGWKRTPTRRWRRYGAQPEAMRAACRALKSGTPLPAGTTDYGLAR